MAKETKIVDGIKVSVDPAIFNDYRVAKKMVQVQMLTKDGNDENPEILIDFDALATLIFGERQFEKIQDHIAKANGGIVPTQAVFDFFGNAVSEFAPKNS